MFKQNLPQRKPNRLKWFDYSSNWWYFLTFCTKNRIQCFGEILDWKMILNDLWKIVENEIYNTTKMRRNIEIDEFIVMPDHIHLILFVIPVGNDCIVPNNEIVPQKENVRNDCIVSNNNRPINGPMQLVPTIMKWLKSTITKQINDFQKDFFFFWQKSYYDRIIRNEDELQKIKQYIINNPLKWEHEKNNIENIFM